ncbi:response regulator [Candidatus Poribacteria bacterium]|nr:response regulator [Candidatus Poribacteria bacterium]
MNNPPKILIVDDIRMNLLLLSKLIQKAGYQSIQSNNGNDGYNKAVSELPDLILLDIMMPEMDGFEVCRSLKENQVTADIPVIFITAKSETVDKVKGLECGAVDYITKPFQPAEVLARIRTQIKLKEANEENLEYQKELLRSQKMASISTLAGGVAHNINNLIGNVIGYADMLQNSVEGNEKAIRYSDRILEASQRIADLTKNLLMYSRASKSDMCIIHIDELLNKMVYLYGNKKSEKINVDIQIPEKVPSIKGDPEQLLQAFTNIFINAQEANINGDPVTISISKDKLDTKKYFGEPEETNVDFLVTSITDKGVGIDRETINRIFEPFFTTKQTVGAGLGLSAVSGIINKHKGAISVESRKNKGSTFHVYLPIANEG